MKKMNIFCTILIVMLNFFKTSRAIDCFKCISENKNNLKCEDPFHNNYTTDILETPCMGGRKGRNGVFPATACIKITGVYDDNKETLTLRSCALDSGTLTTDTELVRTSHCGGFFYENRYVRGCIQSCSDADACNSTQIINLPLLNYVTIVFFLNLLKFF